ncbi:hypothetical protein [Cellulomonas carbonis]|uniref:Uncharacterized protein n=1 Tax=Cellulomonas carbonis T26 TaxID=947969 RepID=A0A0A0BSS5_9CELL|nr:hypothetical protein [Cellulomonas carbonis]KGM10702.1 hypothetical protein N868_14140 [Cellulomonas carbonis T26]GGC07564.1 hypothetical protein GCM10010972_21080 [Cellulomonas carbonis]
MSTTDHVRHALRTDAETADHLDQDAVWASVRTGIHRRRRRRAAASVTGAALLVGGVLVGVPALDEAWFVQTEPAGPVVPPVPEPTGPEPAPTLEPTPAEDYVEVPADALLPMGVARRSTDDGAVPWVLPEECAAGVPSGTTSMVTARDGTGELEAQILVQQVALFADPEQAAAEVDRLAALLEACAGDSDLVGTEPVDVPERGVGVASYFGDGEGGATPFGTYAVVSSRANAVALVTAEGGEGTPEGSRDATVERARGLWERLCTYDAADC